MSQLDYGVNNVKMKFNPNSSCLKGTPANISGLAPRQALLMLAGCRQLCAAPYGGHPANISVVPDLPDVLVMEGIALRLAIMLEVHRGVAILK